MGVQVSPWSLRLQAGRCPADPHKVSMSGSIPEPATLSGRASARLRFIPSANQVRLLGPGLLRPSTQTRKSGHLERVVTLWVRLPPRLLAQLIAPIRCLGVAALHAALSRQRYGIDTRRHRFYGPVVQWPRRPFHMRETMVRVHAGSLIGGEGQGGWAVLHTTCGGFDSHRLHCSGCSSNSRIPASHVGDRGANPRRSTE
jgi:hypothetical protein